MNKQLRKLINRATSSATYRKHKLQWTVGPDMATARCACGCYVQVLTKPQPNQIDIGGDAVTLNCRIPSRV